MVDDQNPSGRGTEAGSLDLSNPRDVTLLNQTLKNRPDRWRGVSDEFKTEIVDGLKEANNLARNAMTTPGETFEAIGAVVAIANTVVRIVGIQQKDDHHAIDAARGAGEHRTENKIIVIPSPVVKDMAEMRKLAEKMEPTP